MAQIEILDRSSMISALKKQLTVDRSETAIVAVDMHRGHLDPSVPLFRHLIGISRS